MNESTCFRPFACCYVVKGIQRSILVDTQRYNFKYLDNAMADLLLLAEKYTISEICALYNHQQDEDIQSIFAKLVASDYGFYTDSPEAFPAIEERFELPSHIYNAWIEYSDNSTFNIEQVLEDLERLQCKSIQFRILGERSFDHCAKIISCLQESYFAMIELHIQWNNQIREAYINEIIEENNRISKVYVYCDQRVGSFDKSKIISHFQERVTVKSGMLMPGMVKEVKNEKTFVTNLTFLLEAKRHNASLNKKVAINECGNIYNAPGHLQSFGNVSTHSLNEVVRTAAFQAKWAIVNDQVSTCRDCEFRYSCVDNSDLEYEGETWKRTLECTYSPYSNSWRLQEEQIHPSD